MQTQTGRQTNTQHVQDDKAGRQKCAKADLHTYIPAHGPTQVTVTSLHVDTSHKHSAHAHDINRKKKLMHLCTATHKTHTQTHKAQLTHV